VKKLLFGLVGAAGLAASASAQVNWTTNLGFAQTTAGPVLAGNSLNLTATGTYTFIVRVGIFNVTGLSSGQANFGLNNWTGAATTTGLTGTDAISVTPTNSRISPFNFGPATSFGGTLVPPGTINNINAARDVSGGATAPWLWDTATSAPGPQPTAPTNAALGNDSLTNVWRFTVNVSTLSGPNIVIHFAGQAGPVVQWAQFGNNPPDETTPGNVSFLGLTPNPVLRDYTAVNLTLVRVPAPGAAALLGLGGLIAARRRR